MRAAAARPKRGKAEPKAQAEGSTGAELGKKTQAKKTEKNAEATTTSARAEGKKKDQDKNKKQDKKGK